VVPEREGLVGYTSSLDQFCWLEALQAMGAGDIFECTNCKTWGRYSWTGRPPMYCSPACKEATYRRRRRLEVETELPATRSRSSRAPGTGR
jgi:hypothetical protein